MTPTAEGGVHVSGDRYALAAVAILRDTRLSTSARLLYAIIKTYANVSIGTRDNPRGSSFVSKGTLAAAMGREDKPVTVRAVENWLGELERCGYLSVLRQTRQVSRPTGVTTVNVPNRYYLDDGLTAAPRWETRGPKPMDAEWLPSPSMIASARKRGLSDVEIEELAGQFRDIQIHGGRERVSWVSAWNSHLGRFAP